jgi:hypothetical protein
MQEKLRFEYLQEFSATIVNISGVNQGFRKIHFAKPVEDNTVSCIAYLLYKAGVMNVNEV